MNKQRSFTWVIVIITAILIIVPFVFGYTSMMIRCSIYGKIAITIIYILAVVFWVKLITSFERVR
jgi:hypothetical protein